MKSRSYIILVSKAQHRNV